MLNRWLKASSLREINEDLEQKFQDTSEEAFRKARKIFSLVEL
jgi:hypothetical protein